MIASQKTLPQKRAAIFICGCTQSGKTTLARVFEQAGICVVSTSSVLKQVAAAAGWPANNRRDLLSAGEKIRIEFGEDWFSECLIQKAGDKGLVVFDGLRFPNTLMSIAAAYSAYIVIFLEHSLDERRNLYNRSTDRSVSFDEITNHLHEKLVHQIKSYATIVFNPPPEKSQAINLVEFLKVISESKL